MSDLPQRVHKQTSAGHPLWSVLKSFLPFVLFIGIGVILVEFTSLGEMLHKEKLESFIHQVGVLPGLLTILVAGILTPLMFLPRWPVAFAAGMHSGMFLGAVVATFASTLGAWLHYRLSRTLMASHSDRLIQKYNLHRFRVPPHREFSAIFFLRAFPLGYFPATNLLAGMLRMKEQKYLLASFLGMLPTSLLWAAGGKLLKDPSPAFYAVAALVLVLMILGTIFAEKKVAAWQEGRQAGESTTPTGT